MRFVGESDDLGLDGGAITGADALNLPVVERRVGQTATQHFVGSLVGVDQRTGTLHKRAVHIGEIRKTVEIILERLLRGELPFYRAAVDAYRGAGLHAGYGETALAQLIRQPY